MLHPRAEPTLLRVCISGYTRSMLLPTCKVYHYSEQTREYQPCFNSPLVEWCYRTSKQLLFFFNCCGKLYGAGISIMRKFSLLSGKYTRKKLAYWEKEIELRKKIYIRWSLLVQSLCPDDCAGGSLTQGKNPPTTTETYRISLTNIQSINQSRVIY